MRMSFPTLNTCPLFSMRATHQSFNNLYIFRSQADQKGSRVPNTRKRKEPPTRKNEDAGGGENISLEQLVQRIASRATEIATVLLRND
jgi:hypothetical protein